MSKVLRILLTALSPAIVLTAAALPTSVDNTRLKYFPPVISQQGGSCAQASGIGYMFTYEINRLLDRDASASAANRFAYLFTWNMVNDGDDNGGFVDQGLLIARNFGVMTEADYGTPSVYDFRWASGYEKYHNAARYRVKTISTYSNQTDADIENIKSLLAAGHVLTYSSQSVGWTFNEDYSGPSETGYHALLTRLATSGSHALTIAGYDDLVESTDTAGVKHKGAFIVINTWGSWFGDKGRFYLPYYFFTHRTSYLETLLSTTVTGCTVYYHEPKIMFRIHLHYTSRDDLGFTYGAASAPFARSASNNYNSVILDHQGGDHAMGGVYNASTAADFEFGIDYTDHMRSDNEAFGRFFLNIQRAQRGRKFGEGHVDYISVIDYRGAQPVEYICRNIAGRELKLGRNDFTIPAFHAGHFSASSVSPLSNDGTAKAGKYYIVRTASGHYAKVRFDGSADALQMKYKMIR